MVESSSSPDVAVMIPCYNEEQVIGKVITDFREALPEATIYVFDNNCTDDTAKIARELGAVVIREKRQGKGFVVATMFKKVRADYYVMVDGDDTYPAEYAPRMLEALIKDEADMIVGSRRASYGDTQVRPFHGAGNRLVRFLINKVFRANVQDPMSGFRAWTREVCDIVPIMATGFDIETELTIQVLSRDLVIHEIDVPYRDRQPGSHSKLRTFSDGTRVLTRIFMLLRAYNPLTFFGLLGLVFIAAGLTSGWVVIWEFIETGIVAHVPLAILTTLLFLSAFLFIITGVILNTINVRLMEAQRLMVSHITRSRQRERDE
jgi:glycosyltransferase involved in cell wall biosynthesis